MVDLSNKALAMVLVAAIVVSIGGTMVSLNKIGSVQGITGFAVQDTGVANITIQSDLSIQFTTALVDFGAGYANDSGGGVEYCDLSTNGTDPAGDCVGFNSGLAPLILENIGNQDITNLTISFSSDAATFIGGTSPGLYYWVNESDATDSCASGLAPATWATVSNGLNQTICQQFNFEASQDELNIHLNVSVPQDAPPATNTQMTITAHAVA